MAKSLVKSNFSRIALITLAVFLAYANSFVVDFQFDDYNVIVNNSKVHSIDGWLSDLKTGIRPLLKLTYTLNWILSQNPSGFHIFNFSIHLFNSILIYFVAIRILSYRFIESQARSIAFVATILFALHPVQTEAITYISGRSVSLMSLFYLLSIFSYLKGSILSVLFLMLAFFVKETAIILPLTLLLVEIYRSNSVSLKGLLRTQGLHWSIIIVLFIYYLIHPHFSFLLSFSLSIRSVWENILTQINGVLYLLTRLFILNGLNIDPDLPHIREVSLEIGIKALILFVFFVVGFFSIIRKSVFGFGILWFFLNLIPTNTIIPRIDVANDRQLYISSIGIFLCFAFLFEKIKIHMKNYKKVYEIGVLTTLVIVLGSFTYLRNLDYKTEITLWEDTAKKSPNKARVYNNLGYAYFIVKRFSEAERAYMKALEINPNYKLAQENLERLRYRLKEEERQRDLVKMLEGS